MPKVDVEKTPAIETTGYPPPYAKAVAGRIKKRLGDAGGLSQFGVNLTVLKPGAASAQRHWHRHEDEFVYIVSGEVALVEDTGESLLRAGEAAAFPAGAANGHHLINRSSADVVLIEIGTRAPLETVDYTDPAVDLRAVKTEAGWRYVRRDGSAW